MNEPTIAAADQLLAKLREFAQTLDEEQRRLLAALLAPGVARALEPDSDDDEVAGFGLVEWLPSRLPAALEHALRERDIRVEGLS